MFDPFKDFITEGYLRNVRKDKNESTIRRMEHACCRMGLTNAMGMLRQSKQVGYAQVKDVHRVLFQSYYPWAGKDRMELTPEQNVQKGRVNFCPPNEIQRAAAYAFELAQKRNSLEEHCGDVLGMLAYAHPFLDGNGRTLLPILTELLRRVGLKMDWSLLDRESYLTALAEEICTPGKGVLNDLLHPHISRTN